jgi:hypothetical protein
MLLSRTLGAVLLGSTVLAGALLLLQSAPASASGPTVTLSKSTGLVGNEVIKVSGTGFSPDTEVGICQRGPSTACDTLLGAVGATTNAQGQLRPTKFTLEAGDVGVDGDVCGTNASNATACYLTVGSVDVPLTFAVPTVTITGAPSTGAVGNASIEVTATGFPAGDSIDFTQCSPTFESSDSSNDCDASQVSGGVANRVGTVKTKFKVLEGETYTDSDSGVCLPSSLGGSGDCVISGSDVDNSVMSNFAPFGFATPTMTVSPTSFPDTDGKKGPATAKLTVSGFPTGDNLLASECVPGLTSCDIDNQLRGVTTGTKGTSEWHALEYPGSYGYPLPKTGHMPILTDGTSPAYVGFCSSSPCSVVTPSSGAEIAITDVQQQGQMTTEQLVTVSS